MIAQNALEENGRLSKVGDFRRAADLGGGCEQKILKDGTQERRGREALGLGLENSNKIGCGVSLVLRVPQPIGLGCSGRDAAKRDARAGFVVDKEQEARLRGNGDLSVIAGGFESLAAFGERGMKLVGALDGGAKNGRTEAMEVAACGVDDEEALLCEDCRVEIREGLREGAAGLVSSNESFSCVGRAEKLSGSLDERGNGIVEDDAARRRCCSWSFLVCEPSQLAAGGKGDVIDLGEIMIFAGEPEDGSVGMASGGRLSRASNGRGCLERAVERATEETYLLAGENSSGAIGESCQRRLSGGRGVLCGEKLNEFRPVLEGAAAALARFRPKAERRGVPRRKNREKGGTGPASRLLDNSRLSRVQSLFSR